MRQASVWLNLAKGLTHPHGEAAILLDGLPGGASPLVLDRTPKALIVGRRCACAERIMG